MAFQRHIIQKFCRKNGKNYITHHLTIELFASKCALNSSISFSKFIFPTVNSASNGFSITKIFYQWHNNCIVIQNIILSMQINFYWFYFWSSHNQYNIILHKMNTFFGHHFKSAESPDEYYVVALQELFSCCCFW